MLAYTSAGGENAYFMQIFNEILIGLQSNAIHNKLIVCVFVDLSVKDLTFFICLLFCHEDALQKSKTKKMKDIKDQMK